MLKFMASGSLDESLILLFLGSGQSPNCLASYLENCPVWGHKLCKQITVAKLAVCVALLDNHDKGPFFIKLVR